MSIHIDTPYLINLYKLSGNPIVLPESLTAKLKSIMTKIERARTYLSKHPERKSKTAAFLEITPEEDVYLHEGWTVKLLVTKNPPVGASLDYREQEKTLYISANWTPNYRSMYHEVVHALDPKARPGYKGYIQRDPDTYFQTTPYFKVPEEIDAIQSSIANEIVETGNFLKNQSDEQSSVKYDQYVNEIRTWLQAPETAPTPSAFMGIIRSESSWLGEPNLRKQFLKRIYWALKQIM